MPEGPSIVILKDLVQEFKGKKILEVTGNSKLDLSRMLNQTIVAIKSWGKHLLVCFKTFTLRIHLVMFGTYRINEHKDVPPRVGFKFKQGELNFYTCAAQYIEGNLDEVYDWGADVLSDAWDPKLAKRKLKAAPDMLVCDALLNQEIFSGVGNIIKVEVLFRTRIHPESRVGALPAKQLAEMVKQARIYSFEFLEWKKAFVLKKHWLAYAKKICPRDQVPFKKEYFGTTQRRTFFCPICQVLYV